MDDKALFLVIFMGIFCGLGIIFLSVSLLISGSRRKLKKQCTSKANAEIIDLHGTYMSRQTSYQPVVQFLTSAGGSVTVRSHFGSNPPKYSVGQNVTVYFDPDDPNKFYIEGDGVSGLVSMIFLFIGAGLILVGVIVGILVWYLWK